MRVLVLVTCLAGCGGAQQATTGEPATLHRTNKVATPIEDAPSAKLPLHWIGEWTSLEAQVTFTFDIVLTPPDDRGLTGRILWTLISAPPDHFLASRVGDTGTEHVKGSWDPNKRELHLTGTSVDSPGFLVVDEYKLNVSADYRSFKGRTRGSKLDWQNVIAGSRAD